MVTVAALTSCVSVLFSLGVVAVLGPLGPPDNPNGNSSITDVAAVADRVRPAVTQVWTTGAGGEQWGSGVIFRSDGMMLTSHRIVSGAESMHIVLDDGRQVGAQLVASDPTTDLALVRLDGKGYTTAVLGSTRGVRVGQMTITVGSTNRSGSGPTVRVGVVSALGQQVVAGAHNLIDMIQTDGAIAPGCSGGAVLNSHGEVIGIAAAAKDGAVVGYATPIEIVEAVVEQLITDGRVWHSWLGIEGDTVSGERARQLGLNGGALVRKVRPASPASAAGLLPTDVIVAVNGAAVGSMSELAGRLRMWRPGEVVTLSIVGNEGERTANARLVERPA